MEKQTKKKEKKMVVVESVEGKEVEIPSQEAKYFDAAAGEYAVLSELNKRYVEAQLTLGNKKAVDIRFFQKSVGLWKSIEVKSTTKRAVITSFFQKYGNPKDGRAKPDFWILVHTDPKTLVSEFWVLTHEELGKVQMKRNKMDRWEEWPKGVDSLTWENLDEWAPESMNGWWKLA